MSLKQIFKSEVNAEIQKHGISGETVFSENDIIHLPSPVQKYFRHCGYIGKTKMMNVLVEWKDVFLKLSPEKSWTGIECYQFNAVSEPARFAYMRSKIRGLVPFEGRDKYQEGHGNMLIKLLKMFTVADSKGLEMDESALVTVLAESLFIPAYALQPYIEWESIDEYAAKATIINNGTRVSGIFYFNELDENIKFETEDRNFTEKDGSFRNFKWTCIIEEYVEKDGINRPSYLRAMWHFPSGDYEYFKGTIVNMKYNVSSLNL